jgi:hypothetical protein
MTRWFDDYALNDVAPNGFTSQFNGTGMIRGANGYFPIDNTFHVYDAVNHVGSGSVVFSNYVSNANNVVVTLMSRAVGGQSFASINDPARWALRVADAQNTWGDASLMPLVSSFVLIHGGEDFGDPVTGIAPQFRTSITTYFGASCLFGLATSATDGDSADGSDFTGRVRGQQNAYKSARLAAGDTTVYDSGAYSFDRLFTADGVHSSAPSDKHTYAETAAIGFVGALAGVMNKATGPAISSIVRTGANIDITWNLNGATTLQVPTANNIKGFDVALTSSNFLPLVGNPTADSTTDTFTQTAHGWSNGDPVIITRNGGSMPTGITIGVTYFIVNATTNTYQLSATVGGSAVNFTTNGLNLWSWNTKSLLAQTSHLITGANTTRIVLAANPGASVMVMHWYGRPSKQIAGSFDPNPTDPTGRSAMTELWGPVAPAGAQGNFLNDNWPRSYPTTTTIGRLAQQFDSPITVP